MSAQPKPNEPSMEEILASIRRIIADDDKPAAAAPAAEPESAPVAPEPQEPEPATDIDDDVLDLGAEASLVTAPEQAPEDVQFRDAPEPAAPEPEPEPVAEPQPPLQTFTPPSLPPAAAAAPAPQLDMAALISDQTSSAVQNAFGALAHTVLSNNARTLEDLVKDMLKPMLKTWLDDNLPIMVERLVRAEIERVARGGRN